MVFLDKYRIKNSFNIILKIKLLSNVLLNTVKKYLYTILVYDFLIIL